MKRLLRRLVSGFRPKERLSVGARVEGAPPRAIQRVLVRGRGTLACGENVQFGWQQSPCFESTYAYVAARFPGSKITIGDDCIFSNDAAIVSEHECNEGSIVIGSRCVFGVGFRCYDSDFHGLQAAHRNVRKFVRTARISIGDDCFFGERCMVLKGVTLGNRCVIGAGSVVTKSFPDDSLIAGNPAILVRRIDQAGLKSGE